MVRQLQISVPAERARDVGFLLSQMKNAHGVCMLEGPRHCVFTCKCDTKRTVNVLRRLGEAGVGTEFGSIDIIELTSTIPRLAHFRRGKEKKRKYRVNDHMSNEEIYQSIDSQIHLTFNYLLLLMSASLIAATGLIQDSSAIVVASMIVSPLMAPLLGFTYGSYIADWPMVFVSIRNTVIGVLLVWAVGAICGLFSSPYFIHGDVQYDSDSVGNPLRGMYPTEEMYSRGTWVGLIFGVAIAVPSGIAVAIAVTGGVSSTLVGIAISAALLPPIVNSGLNVAYALMFTFTETNRHFVDLALQIAGYSMALFIENIVFIYLCAMITFWVKGIQAPMKESMNHDPGILHGFTRTDVTGGDKFKPPVYQTKAQDSFTDFDDMTANEDGMRKKMGHPVPTVFVDDGMHGGELSSLVSEGSAATPASVEPEGISACTPLLSPEAQPRGRQEKGS